nr:hypothetical protein [Actinomycetota bacterium]
DKTYAKLAGVTYVWAFFALIVLGLALAAHPNDRLARGLYVGAAGAAVLGGVIATVLVLDAGDAEIATGAPIPYAPIGNGDLLRPLGAVLVVLAALWFATLATTRVDRSELTR